VKLAQRIGAGRRQRQFPAHTLLECANALECGHEAFEAIGDRLLGVLFQRLELRC
jgi:hypothetical protein